MCYVIWDKALTFQVSVGIADIDTCCTPLFGVLLWVVILGELVVLVCYGCGTVNSFILIFVFFIVNHVLAVHIHIGVDINVCRPRDTVFFDPAALVGMARGRGA